MKRNFADKDLTLHGPRKVSGRVIIPGDKSIGHRALILAALLGGMTRVSNLPDGEDVASTASVLTQLGVFISQTESQVIVESPGFAHFSPPSEPLDCGNSGTTMRLMSGVLSACPFSSTLVGDSSLSSRPMERIAKPLRMMGASLTTTEGHAPLHIQGCPDLSPIHYQSPVSSAQVKSAILLAGLVAGTQCSVTEPFTSRDHTERMLPWFQNTPSPRELTIPGDVSSASFFIVAALIAGDSSIHLPSVGINPTRMGLIDTLLEMGAQIDIHPTFTSAGEPIADLTIHRSELTANNLSGESVVRCIDEIPIFSIAAATATGMSQIRDAHELRVKECDRIDATCKGLANMGVSIKEYADGFDVVGQKKFYPGTISSFGDHRLAMSFAIASLHVDGPIQISDANVVSVSYPGFYRELERICLPH